jgi:hypothetical protein
VTGIEPRSSAWTRLDDYFSSRQLVPKLLIWATTALFLGFSLGVSVAHVAAMNAPRCIEGQSLLAPPSH